MGAEGRECVTRGRVDELNAEQCQLQGDERAAELEIGTMPGRGRGVRVGGVCGHSILLLNGS